MVIKKYLNRLFIDGLSGMASGLFATLIIGTIIAQVGNLIGGTVGAYLIAIGSFAKTITGAGIGVGVAAKLGASPLVTVSAAVAGYCGGEGNENGISWSFDSSTGTLTITGAGAMENWYHEMDLSIVDDYGYNIEDYLPAGKEYVYTPWYSFRNDILHAVVSDGITTLGDFTFSGCTKLKDVTLGKDLTVIGHAAFEECESLQGIAIPEKVKSIGVGAFYSNIGLTSVVIPEGVESLDYGAFSFCSNLNEITLPATLKNMNALCFAFCEKLASVAIPMARAFGARVITSVLSNEIAEKIKPLGADVIINSSTQCVEEILATEEKNGTAVNVSMDCLSGETLGKSLPYMARGGYWIVISTLAGIETTVQLRPLLTKGLHLVGSMLRNRTPEFKAYILSELVKNVWPKIEDGTIKPSIYKVLPITNAEAAHAILERGENVGKVVLSVCDE